MIISVTVSPKYINRQDMDECLNTLRTEMESPALGVPGSADLLGGNHQWDTTNHTRPTYCNVCKDTLHGEKYILFVSRDFEVAYKPLLSFSSLQ